MKLIALTACGVDFYPQINKSFPGGNSLNVAAMWKNMDQGDQVSVITCLGSDYHGSIIMDFFKSSGIDVSRVTVREGPTTSNQLKVDADGERYGIEGTWLGGVNEDFFLSGEDWEWLADQDLIAIPANNPNFEWMLRKRRRNQVLAVDYLDVENGIDLAQTIKFTDMAFIAASKEQISAFRELAFEKDKLLIVTMGAEGSAAFHDGKEYFQPALPVEKPTDTTACGDAYQAAFALTFLKSQDVKSSMKAGAEAALKVIRLWGGAASLFTEQSPEFNE